MKKMTERKNEMVNGFFDIEFHLDDLSRNGDPLVKLKSLIPWESFRASSAVCEKLASNDDFEIVVRQIENLEAHIFKISVSIRLSKHCPYLVIETFHRGIGHVSETPESQNPIPML